MFFGEATAFGSTRWLGFQKFLHLFSHQPGIQLTLSLGNLYPCDSHPYRHRKRGNAFGTPRRK